MEFNAHLSFPLKDRSFQNIVKRDISRLALKVGLSAGEVGKVNIVVAEMTSNLFKHGAVDGEILVKTLGSQESGLEILCLDKGPGMSQVHRMVEDGVSTASTRGEGLGAIKRLSDEFDIFSQKGVGTIILSRIYKKEFIPKKNKSRQFEVGVVVVPKTGEKDCGDGWVMRQVLGKCHILVTDGLGHGEFAQLASKEAKKSFQSMASLSPVEIIRQIHEAIKSTRGVVGTVLTIDLHQNLLTFCGVGNIAGRVLNGPGNGKGVLSYNGILGHNIPTTLNNHQIEWGPGSVLVLHSDGLRNKWDLSAYKNLLRHDSSIIAALMYKEFNRGTDDNLVLVVKTHNIVRDGQGDYQY